MIMMVMKLDSRIIDVETAFLFGDLDEEVYMTCKEVHEEDEALLLMHAIYGLVQASRQFWIKYVLKSLNGSVSPQRRTTRSTITE